MRLQLRTTGRQERRGQGNQEPLIGARPIGCAFQGRHSVCQKRTRTKRLRLTQNVQVEGLAGALALAVGRVAGVAAGGRARHPLQHQTRIADDDTGADVVLQHLALAERNHQPYD